MKTFSCGDVVPGCEARWVCSTEDDILHRVAEHARSAHGMSEVGPELVDSVRAAITTLPV